MQILQFLAEQKHVQARETAEESIFLGYPCNKPELGQLFLEQNQLLTPFRPLSRHFCKGAAQFVINSKKEAKQINAQIGLIIIKFIGF